MIKVKHTKTHNKKVLNQELLRLFCKTQLMNSCADKDGRINVKEFQKKSKSLGL